MHTSGGRIIHSAMSSVTSSNGAQGQETATIPPYHR